MIRSLASVLSFLTVLTPGCTAAPAGIPLSPLSGALFINEFMAANSSVIHDEGGDFDDWIELYNAGDTILSLNSMFLTDDFAAPTRWALPDTYLAPGGYLLIWADTEVSEGPLHAIFKLKAEGEQVGLFAMHRDNLFVVDTMTYGPLGKNISCGRLPDGGSRWYTLTLPTPGGKNLSGSSDLSGRLLINEFMAANRSTIADENGDYDDWIELYNASSSPIGLDGVYLTDDLTLPKKWALPSTTIPGHGFALIWADNECDQGPLHANFNLAAATGEQLGLYEDQSGYALVIDSLSFGPQSTDTSFGRMPDGATSWQRMSRPTPGASNRGR
ncbi:MAG: lamin tail domain-containing protein [candidate division WOR-3 bacterium]